MTLGKKPLENIVGKGENAVYQHYLLFLQCLLPYQRKYAKFENAFSLDKADILSSGKGLKYILVALSEKGLTLYQMTKCWTGPN